MGLFFPQCYAARFHLSHIYAVFGMRKNLKICANEISKFGYALEKILPNSSRIQVHHVMLLYRLLMHHG